MIFVYRTQVGNKHDFCLNFFFLILCRKKETVFSNFIFGTEKKRKIQFVLFVYLSDTYSQSLFFVKKKKKKKKKKS